MVRGRRAALFASLQTCLSNYSLCQQLKDTGKHLSLKRQYKNRVYKEILHKLTLSHRDIAFKGSNSANPDKICVILIVIFLTLKTDYAMLHCFKKCLAV
jgi:hypothetical protein